MSTTDRQLRVFLCHASQDKPIVRELYQQLLAKGWIDPWLDEEKLLPGQDWEFEIEKSVEDADVVIVCLSKTSVEKEGFYQKELKKVLDVADEKPEGTIFIIPLRLDECQPPRRLSKWQYVDYFPSDNSERSYRNLIQSLIIRANIIGIYENGRCYLCDQPILTFHSWGTCLYCDTPYHKDCWDNNIGCNKFGCEGNYKSDHFYQR